MLSTIFSDFSEFINFVISAFISTIFIWASLAVIVLLLRTFTELLRYLKNGIVRELTRVNSTQRLQQLFHY